MYKFWSMIELMPQKAEVLIKLMAYVSVLFVITGAFSA